MAPHTKDNLDVAATAREMADTAPKGTVQQAAAGAVAVTCATTRDLGEARDVLRGVTPDEVRRAAIDLFNRLSEEGPERHNPH